PSVDRPERIKMRSSISPPREELRPEWDLDEVLRTVLVDRPRVRGAEREHPARDPPGIILDGRLSGPAVARDRPEAPASIGHVGVIEGRGPRPALELHREPEEAD